MGLCCLGSWLRLPAARESWVLRLLVAVRNEEVMLGQMGTTFSYSSPLDPLNASRAQRSPVLWIPVLSAQ